MEDKLFEDEAEYWYNIGNSSFANKEYKKAVEAFEKTVKIEPKNAKYQCALSISYRSDNQFDKAIEAMEKVIELDSKNVKYLYNLGLLFYSDKQYDKSIEVMEKTVEIEPQNSSYWCGLGIAFRDNEQYDIAVETILKAIELDSNNADYWSGLAMSYYSNKQYSEAVETMEKVVEIDTKNPSYWYGLGRVYRANEQCDKSIEALNKAIEIKPGNAQYWNELGVTYRFNHMYNQSIEAMMKSIEIEPNNAKYLYELAILYQITEQDSKAMEVISKAVEIEPQESKYWLVFGVSHFPNGKFKESINLIKKAIEIKADNVDYWYILWLAYNLDKQHDKAVDSIKKAIEIESQISLYWNALGHSYDSLDQFDEAVKAKETTIKLEPCNVTYWYDLAFSFVMMQKYDNATNCFSIGNTFGNQSEIIHNLNVLLSRLIDKSNALGLRFVGENNIEYLTGTQFTLLKTALITYKELSLIKTNMINIFLSVRRIMNVLALDSNLCQVDKIKLAHYTKAQNISYLLKKEIQESSKEFNVNNVKLRMYHSSYMNDPSEGMVLNKYLKKKHHDKSELLSKVLERSEESLLMNTVSRSVYLFSMTSNIDDLPMWAQYGEKGEGCCLIFDENFFDYPKYQMQHELRIEFDNVANVEVSIKKNLIMGELYIPYAVMYVNEKNNTFENISGSAIQVELDRIVKCVEEAEKLCDNEKTKEDIIRYVTQCLEQIRFLFKSKDYEYEKEYRLVKIVPYDSGRIQLDNDAKPIPRLYIEKEDGKPLKYSSIILGPKVYQTNEIIPYIRYVDQDIQIQKSKVKYR